MSSIRRVDELGKNMKSLIVSNLDILLKHGMFDYKYIDGHKEIRVVGILVEKNCEQLIKVRKEYINLSERSKLFFLRLNEFKITAGKKQTKQFIAWLFFLKKILKISKNGYIV